MELESDHYYVGSLVCSPVNTLQFLHNTKQEFLTFPDFGKVSNTIILLLKNAAKFMNACFQEQIFCFANMIYVSITSVVKVECKTRWHYNLF